MSSPSDLVKSSTISELEEHAKAIRKLGKRIIEDVVEIGRRLVDAKKLCGHGNWLPWLDANSGGLMIPHSTSRECTRWPKPEIFGIWIFR
jgi:hypothetical protein